MKYFARCISCHYVRPIDESELKTLGTISPICPQDQGRMFAVMWLDTNELAPEHLKAIARKASVLDWLMLECKAEIEMMLKLRWRFWRRGIQWDALVEIRYLLDRLYK